MWQRASGVPGRPATSLAAAAWSAAVGGGRTREAGRGSCLPVSAGRRTFESWPRPPIATLAPALNRRRPPRPRPGGTPPPPQLVASAATSGSWPSRAIRSAGISPGCRRTGSRVPIPPPSELAAWITPPNAKGARYPQRGRPPSRPSQQVRSPPPLPRRTPPRSMDLGGVSRFGLDEPVSYERPCPPPRPR